MSDLTLQEMPAVNHDASGLPQSDAELLRRFSNSRDDASFEELVRRHGPTVHGVCRRVLGNHADADDAFQMTFLVLARKSAEIRHPELLGNWLFGVAYQTANKARRKRHTRNAMSLPVIQAETPQPDKVAVMRELQSVIDEELHEIPERYRSLLVMAFYEELTHEQIAARLGWPPGSVSRRMSKARDMLRSRLKRRGLALSIGLLMVLLNQLELSAAVPPGLIASTATLATSVTAGDAFGDTGSPFASGPFHLSETVRMWLSGLLLAVLTLGIFGLVGNTSSTGKARVDVNQAPIESAEPPPAMCPHAIHEAAMLTPDEPM